MASEKNSLLQSNDLSEALYQLNWDDFHIKEKKMLLLMLLKSQRKYQLRAGKLLELNYATVTQVGM